MITEQPQQRYFSLLLAVKPGSDPIRALRAVLKIAGRRFALRCIDVREVNPPAVEEPAEPRP